MKGLEVARRFFAEWGLPFLQERFPELTQRVVAGLFRGAVIHERLEAVGLASQDLSVHPRPLFCDHVALRQRVEHEQAITRE